MSGTSSGSELQPQEQRKRMWTPERKEGGSETLVLMAPAPPAEPLNLPDYLGQSGISGAVLGPLDSVIFYGIPNGTTTATRWHQTVARPGMNSTVSWAPRVLSS